MPTIAWVALGGACGASARWLVARSLASWTAWPLGTFVVNVLGCFALGFLLARTEGQESWNEARQAVFATGFLGAFTTFSTFAADGDGLFRRESSIAALTYVGLSVVLGFAAYGVGRALARAA